MGRTFALMVGLALGTSAWTAVGALQPALPDANVSSASLRIEAPERAWAPGPVAEVPPPRLMGRYRPPVAIPEPLTAARAPRAHPRGPRPSSRQTVVLAVRAPWADRELTEDTGRRPNGLSACSDDAQDHVNESDARRLFDDQWTAVFASLEYGSQVVTVKFPEDWLDGIADGAPHAADAPVEERDGSAAAILNTLETQRVKSLTWEEGTTLDEVVDYLRTLTGLNFYITPEVRAELYDEVEPTLQLDDVTVRTVLDLVTEPYELAWVLEDGVVKIATADEIRGEMYTRYHDILDLAVTIESIGGQRTNLDPWRVIAPEFPDPPERSSVHPEDGLVALVKKRVGDDADWADPATIEIRNRVLIVRNTEAVLDRVQQVLDEIRASGRLFAVLTIHEGDVVSVSPVRRLDR